jgi:hypothetical protein
VKRAMLAAMLAGHLGAQLPDPRLTPGAVMNATAEQVCTPGWSRAHRDVSIETKNRVYREYGMTYVHGEAEVDHLVPLELGGSNDIRNLWPEPYAGELGAYTKDALEHKAHAMVCNGQIDLTKAQRWIATDWIGFYKWAFRTDRPLARHRREQ